MNVIVCVCLCQGLRFCVNVLNIFVCVCVCACIMVYIGMCNPNVSVNAIVSSSCT